MRTEYRIEDLGEGTRGKYSKSFQSGSNLVLFSPDVAEAFPTDKAVNDALRSLMNRSQNTDPTRRSSRREKELHG